MFNSHFLCVCVGTRKQIQDINWQRKNEQLTGGAKLRELESKYVRLSVSISPSSRRASACGRDVNICPSTAGWLWSVRTTRSSGPSSSWRTKSLGSDSSRATRTRRTSGKTFRCWDNSRIFTGQQEEATVTAAAERVQREITPLGDVGGHTFMITPPRSGRMPAETVCLFFTKVDIKYHTQLQKWRTGSWF